MGHAAQARSPATGGVVQQGPWERAAAQIGRIQLAHEPPIELGSIIVEPALRRIAHHDGREEIVEPRVMQVFVALIRSGGRILARDDLIACCWEGRIVGDDAINRVISRLRRIEETLGCGLFRIETINKVGYRLIGNIPVLPPRVANQDTAVPPVSSEPKERPRESVYVMVVVRGVICSDVMGHLLSVPRVALIDKLSGPIDLLIRLDGDSIAEIEESRSKIAATPGVASVSTAVVLERYLG
jgi:DNA-binding winged helix-turn-helix (wHTH) protein